MSLLDKLSAFADEKKELLSFEPAFSGILIEEIHSATEATIAGRRVVLAGTNNYLGLTFAPECLKAAHEAIDSAGTGTTGSRMANGNYPVHRALEKDLAEFYQCRSCIVFSTGYQANLGTISGLAGQGDICLIDSHCHASIYDGCLLSGADIIRFRHNDTEDLQKRLRRLGPKASSTLIIVEGIYSMLGDSAPLGEITRLKQEYGGYILIDEAHSLGVMGATGKGLVEKLNLLAEVDFITGTFSKSLGSIGGYCVSNHPELETVRFMSRPYIFTASPSPSNIASTRAALPLLRDGKALREQLWRHADYLYTTLMDSGYQLGPEPGPVIAVQLDNNRQALEFWSTLLQRGIYVNLVFPPASPDGKPLIRCSLSAAHTDDQVKFMGEIFTELREKPCAP